MKLICIMSILKDKNQYQKFLTTNAMINENRFKVTLILFLFQNNLLYFQRKNFNLVL